MDVEDAVTEMMEQIDEHEAAGSKVSRRTTIDFYKGLAMACKDRAASIAAESDEDDEDLDDGDDE